MSNLSMNLGLSFNRTALKPYFVQASPSSQRYITGEVNASEGTVIVEVTDNTPQPAGSEVVFSLDGSAVADSLYLFKTTSNGGTWRLASNTAGSEQFRYVHGYQSILPGKNVFMLVWKANDLRFYINGDLVYYRTSYTAPTDFGKGFAVGLFGNNDGLPYTSGTINKATYYDKALTDVKARRKGVNNNIRSGITQTDEKTIVKNGQSNSVGQATGTPTYTNASDMHMIGNDLTRKAYSDPYDDSTGHFLHRLADASQAQVGAAGYTLDILAGRLNDTVAVMGLNKGGTSMQSNWRVNTAYSGGFVNGPEFGQYIQGLKVATQYSSDVIIENWQGESDAYAGVSQSDYEEYFTDFILETHKAMQMQFEWIIVGLHDWHSDLTANATESEWNAITAARQAVANKFDFCTFVSLAGIAGASGDRVHLDLTGYSTAGSRIADAIVPA